MPIESYETKIKINMKRASSLYIRRTQFSLGGVGFNLNKQKAFNKAQMYTALSRITSLSGLFLTSYFNKSSIRANEKAEHVYD